MVGVHGDGERSKYEATTMVMANKTKTFCGTSCCWTSAREANADPQAFALNVVGGRVRFANAAKDTLPFNFLGHSFGCEPPIEDGLNPAHGDLVTSTLEIRQEGNDGGLLNCVKAEVSV